VLEALMDRPPACPPMGWPTARAKRWARRSARRNTRRVLRDATRTLRASLAEHTCHFTNAGDTPCHSSD
jgi:hypothetical protein